MTRGERLHQEVRRLIVHLLMMPKKQWTPATQQLLDELRRASEEYEKGCA